MINNTTIEHKPISELMAIVKNDFRKFDAEGLIDDSNFIKTVMYCNDKLGLHIREIKEKAIPVNNYKAILPLDFEKLFYVCALQASNTNEIILQNPFDNNFDQDIIYEANLDRQSLGCVDNYQVTIKKESKNIVYNYGNWIQLEVKDSEKYCHIDCPNKRKKGTYQIEIKDGYINTPFKSGTLYMVYIGAMIDEEGEILFPFHPLITPYYEWSIKEKVLSDAMFNSDASNIQELYKLANFERKAAWLDAFNFSTDRSYSDFTNRQRKKELGWYNTWFKYFQ